MPAARKISRRLEKPITGNDILLVTGVKDSWDTLTYKISAILKNANFYAARKISRRLEKPTTGNDILLVTGVKDSWDTLAYKISAILKNANFCQAWPCFYRRTRSI